MMELLFILDITNLPVGLSTLGGTDRLKLNYNFYGNSRIFLPGTIPTWERRH